MMRAMHIVLSGPLSAADIWQEHEKITKAICDGDSEAAARYATSHAQTSGQLTFENLLASQSRSA